jgi:MerR family transcriptional regulator/heat shock protein HspR
MALAIDPLADPNEPLYTIAVASDLTGLHAQTLRKYDNLGYIQAVRTMGNIRLFTPASLVRAKQLADLTMRRKGLTLEIADELLEGRLKGPNTHD